MKVERNREIEPISMRGGERFRYAIDDSSLYRPSIGHRFVDEDRLEVILVVRSLFTVDVGPVAVPSSFVPKEKRENCRRPCAMSAIASMIQPG